PEGGLVQAGVAALHPEKASRRRHLEATSGAAYELKEEPDRREPRVGQGKRSKKQARVERSWMNAAWKGAHHGKRADNDRGSTRLDQPRDRQDPPRRLRVQERISHAPSRRGAPRSAHLQPRRRGLPDPDARRRHYRAAPRHA